MHFRMAIVTTAMIFCGCSSIHRETSIIPTFDTVWEAEYHFDPKGGGYGEYGREAPYLDKFATVVFFPFYPQEYRFDSNRRKFAKSDLANFKTHLTTLGVEFPPGSKITVRIDKHELIITNTMRNLRRVQQIRDAAGNPSAAAKASFLLIGYPVRDGGPSFDLESGRLAELLLREVADGKASILASNEITTLSGYTTVSDISGAVNNRLELTPVIEADGVSVYLDFRWELAPKITSRPIDEKSIPTIYLENRVTMISGTAIVIGQFSCPPSLRSQDQPLRLFVVLVTHAVDTRGWHVVPRNK